MKKSVVCLLFLIERKQNEKQRNTDISRVSERERRESMLHKGIKAIFRDYFHNKKISSLENVL
jgi:hypothetical protein